MISNMLHKGVLIFAWGRHSFYCSILNWGYIVMMLAFLAGCVQGSYPISDNSFVGPNYEQILAKNQQEGSIIPTRISSVVAGPTSTGLLIVIPGTLSTSGPEAVSAAASLGVGYMRVNLDWAISEPKPGQITYDSRNDRIIQRIEQVDLRVFPTLYVGRGWMNGNPLDRGEGGSRSYPPNDLSNRWDDQHGYSPSYYNFVFEFFTHYRGHFDYVAIENEASSKLFWGGSSEEYFRLIKTAYKAIKAADPNVTVVDSGFVSASLGLCIADDELNSGRKTMDEVIQFVMAYYREETGMTRIQTASQLEKVLRQPKVQEQCRRINYILDRLGGAVDAVNFHFYEDYRALPSVVEWLHLRTMGVGYSPAFVTNELGIRGQDISFAESPAHAREVFKKLVTAQSLGLRAIIWFSADTIQRGKDKVGLFDKSGKMRPAAQTHKLTIETLDTQYRFKTTLASGPSLFRHVFENLNGTLPLEALWIEGDPQSLQLTAPAGATQAVIINYLGESETYIVKEGSLQLFISEAPIFVVWK